MSDFGKLYTLMQNAHKNSALENDNISSRFIKEMAIIGKSYTEAIAVAILSLGEVHAPVYDARQVLFHTPDAAIKMALEDGLKIPGFGNSFYKESIDPAWDDFVVELNKEWPEYASRLNEVTEIINTYKQLKLYPNPAAFTAIVAEILNMEPGTEISLFILARIFAWNQQWVDYK